MTTTERNSQISTIEDNETRLGIGGTIARADTVSSAIQLAAAMLDKRIATARAYPRSISRFKREAADLLREDIETARQAEYAKPVGGGTVRGPSVRLAELAAMCWGNIDVKVDEPIVGDKSVSVKASAWDLERNNTQEAVVTTSILNKSGARYAAHMIETTGLATAAKARRNAILLVIPRAYIQDLLQIAKAVAAGQEKSLEQTRLDMLDYFARTHKIQPEAIFAMLAVDGPDDIGQEQIDELRAVVTAIKEGSSPDEFFAIRSATKAEELKAKIADRKAAQVGNGNGGHAEAPKAVESPKSPAKEEPAEPKVEPPTAQLDTADIFAELCKDLGKQRDCTQSDAINAILGECHISVPDIDELTPAQLVKVCDLARRKLAEKPAKKTKATTGKLVDEPDQGAASD